MPPKAQVDDRDGHDNGMDPKPAGEAHDQGGTDHGTGHGTDLGPIGPERLAQLREAIRNGTYPTESDVVGGLVRLFDRND